MKTKVWMTYDLGMGGDYENLYKWLDSQRAQECGGGIAFFGYEYDKDAAKEIIMDLKSKVNLEKDNRIYLIFKKENTEEYAGRFIFGGRKIAPWEGFAEKYAASSTDRDWWDEDWWWVS